MRQVLLVLLLATGVASARGDATAVLLGAIAGDTYVSPTGAFQIRIPVLPSLGGSVRDTANVVTFRDDFGYFVTVAAFAQDSTQRWEFSTRGVKDYLIYFFGNFVLADFKRFFPDTSIQSAGFAGDLMDGTLFTYILIPGGSMFSAPGFGNPAKEAAAKRGNMSFVHNGFTFVISTELSERVTEGAHFNKTPEEENKILRERLVEVARQITFLKTPPSK